MSGKSWLAAYLYCAEPWEEILAGAVKPFVEEVLGNQWAENYFFIRYWERGPHIRLRFYGDTQTMEQEIKPRLVQHFEDWYAKHPSERETPDWVKDLPPEGSWYANDSIQFIEYEPETERYGGPAGIGIAEQQFRVSSDAILTAISESEGWSYDRALGLAIQMHLGFAHAFGMDIRALQAFYRIVAKGWMPRAYYFTPETTKEEHDAKKAEALEAFETTYAGQKEMLVSFCETLWEALTEGVEFEQQWVNHYLAGLKEVAARLQAAGDRIECRELYFKETAKDLPPEQTRFWPILESYIHMTNNRLGVLNRDEAFLGYLIEKTMAEF